MLFKFQSYHLRLSFLSLRTRLYFVSYLQISLWATGPCLLIIIGSGLHKLFKNNFLPSQTISVLEKLTFSPISNVCLICKRSYDQRNPHIGIQRKICIFYQMSVYQLQLCQISSQLVASLSIATLSNFKSIGCEIRK